MNTYVLTLLVLIPLACLAKKQKVFYLNSYHEGYGSSDQIQKGIVESLDPNQYELKIFYLNAKRLEADELSNRAKVAWETILTFNPDIVLSSDDNAIESVIIPHLTELACPLLFCGVNWTAEKYNLPTDRVTGMLEVLPVEKCINLIKASGYQFNAITVLSEKSIGEEKNKEVLIPLFEGFGLTVEYIMVGDFQDWKHAFRESQTDGNVVFLPTNGAIRAWNQLEAVQFVSENSKVPVFTCDDFMVPYSAFGLTKVAREQGVWVAERAKEILGGKSVKDFPISKNNQFECFVNNSLSGKIKLVIPDTNLHCKSF